MNGINPIPAALEVVEVLHKNKIPIALAQSVFDEAMCLIRQNTVPYSPKLLRISEEAKSEITGMATVP